MKANIANKEVPQGREETDLLIPEDFSNVIGYHLRVAQEASFAAFGTLLQNTDLKPGWYTILTILSQHDGLTPSELSKVCGRDRSTLTSTLKKLSIRGLIDREQIQCDQRSYKVRLTEEGQRMQAKLRAIAQEHDRRLDEIVGDDKDALLAVLTKIIAAFSKG